MSGAQRRDGRTTDDHWSDEVGGDAHRDTFDSSLASSKRAREREGEQPTRLDAFKMLATKRALTGSDAVLQNDTDACGL